MSKSRITIKAQVQSDGEKESINIDLLFDPRDALKVATYAMQLFNYRSEEKRKKIGEMDEEELARSLEGLKT